MDCARVETEDLAGSYVLGRLEASEAEAFEDHYFDCEGCLALVEAARLAREDLRARRAPPARRLPAWLLAAASFAAVGVAVTILRTTAPARPSPGAPSPAGAPRATPDPRWADLARVAPPAYRPSRLRSEGEAGGAFAETMSRYRTGGCAAAIEGLEEAVASDATSPAPAFYLGACRLVLGQTEAGVRDLEVLVELGDSDYRDEARFYLAKGLLAAGRIAEARAQLEALARSEGAWRDEARGMLGTLAERDASR